MSFSLVRGLTYIRGIVSNEGQLFLNLSEAGGNVADKWEMEGTIWSHSQ